jgi:hypothetical protein
VTVIRGANIKIELYLSGAWTELTCDTTSAEWTWGAPEALGPLTECEGGTLRVSLYDPTRKYDPDNPSSPLLGVLKVGLGFRVTVDAAPAWTGVLQTWGWDRASKIADLNGLDPIGQLSVRALPDRMTLMPVAATSGAQAQYLLDQVEWPSAKRYFPSGTTGVSRGNHYIEGSALDGLHQIRFAELGRLYPMRDGRIGWHDRAGPTPPASSANVNCTGVDLMDMWKAMGLGRLRNHVVIAGGYGKFGPVLPPDEYRSVTTTPAFLQFDYGGGSATPLPWDLWANTIIDALNPPPVLTMLGTMLPEGAEVKTVTTAEFGSRWTVKVTGSADVVVQVFGMTVSVSPGTIEVDAVTEDVVTPKPVTHLLPGSGSGALLSMNEVSYANARAGIGTITVEPSSPSLIQLAVGQYLAAGPEWGVHEAFLWFDTSSIPVGATITKAKFAAFILPQYSPGSGDTWVDFDLQVRSYPSGGWRPTLAAADWIPGASLGSNPLRAKWSTVNGVNLQEFEDVSMAAAIVKGGATQLIVVSSRTVSGTAPSVNPKEDVILQYARLRITYQ